MRFFFACGALAKMAPTVGQALHLRAVAAGGCASLPGAAADGAELFAEHGFGPVCAAALTVDMLGQNGRVVQFRPEFGGLFPQRLIVMKRGDIGVALFAVQPAVSDVGSHG